MNRKAEQGSLFLGTSHEDTGFGDPELPRKNFTEKPCESCWGPASLRPAHHPFPEPGQCESLANILVLGKIQKSQVCAEISAREIQVTHSLTPRPT